MGSRAPPGDAAAEAFLNAQLDEIFGGSFSAVIAYEFKKRHSSSLYRTLMRGEAEARTSLLGIFRSDRAVSLIFYALIMKLRESRQLPESAVLLGMLENHSPRP